MTRDSERPLRHTLIPRFIHDQYQAGNDQGHLQAVTLFMDISGFTAMTQSLMQHGKAGAEAVARIINRLLAPVIETIHAHGGFITGFAGDAIAIIFQRHNANAAILACHAAWTIAHIFIDQGIQRTPFGRYRLVIRQGLSAGKVEWGIVGAETHKAFFFRGAAVDGCSQSEQQAQAGQIILDSHLQALLPEGAVRLQPIDTRYAQIMGMGRQVIVPKSDNRPQTTLDPQIAFQFFPELVWTAVQQGELREVATLFISLQGIPNLAAMDRFFAQVMTILARFDGYFVEIDFGDKGGLMIVYFGAPTAHEDDIERALSFIDALQAETADTSIIWRAGLTYGSVYAGYVGSPMRDKYTCMGSIVNLAARMMVRAEWGQILVSESIISHPGFEFVSLGELPYKGFAQPIPTYRLRGKIAVERIFTHRIVGRESELQRLNAFAQPLFAGPGAGTAVIYGEAGMGKSHLSHAFSQALAGRAAWFTCQSDSILRQPFNPFVYLLRNYFRQSAVVSEAQNKANFQRRLDDLLTALAHTPGAERQQDELRRTQSFLGALLGLYWPNSLYEQLDAEARYRNTITAVDNLLEAECLRRPVVLELEDGHWFDAASIEAVTILARQAANLPLLVLITSRYNDDGTRPAYAFSSQIPALEIDLAPLATAALHSLAEDILGMPVDEGLKRLLAEKTQATPFFAQQILYYLQQNNLIRVVNGSGKKRAALSSESFDLPSKLNASLVARLDRLRPEVKEVVQTAAILGREFELRLLSRMLKRDIGAEIARAEQEQIWTALNQSQYTFKHVLMRDAAYDMQLRSRLRELHFLAAETAEQLYTQTLPTYYGSLAHHYETAYQLGRRDAGKKAVHYLEQAGRQALENFENDTAVHYISRALALTAEADVAKRFELFLSREKACNMQGDRTAQSQDLATLESLAAEMGTAEQVTVALRQANYHYFIANFPETIRYSQSVIALSQRFANSDADMLIRGYRVWGMALWRLARYPEAQAQLHKGLELARQSDNQREVANCLHFLGVVASEFDDHTITRKYHLEALAIRRSIGDLQGESASLNSLGVLADSEHDFESGKQYLEQALAIRNKIGDRIGYGGSLNNLGTTCQHQGDLAQAEKYLEESLKIRREVDDRWGEAMTLFNLGAVAELRERYDLTQTYFEQSLTICIETDDLYGEGIVFNALAFATLMQNDLAQAEAYCQKSLNIRLQLEQPHFLVENWALLAKIRLAQGDRESAAYYLMEVIGYLEENPRLEGAENSMRTFRIVWESLAELEQYAPAAEVLAKAAQVMQEYLDRHPNPAVQKMYLQIPDNQLLWQAWQQWNDQKS